MIIRDKTSKTNICSYITMQPKLANGQGYFQEPFYYRYTIVKIRWSFYHNIPQVAQKCLKISCTASASGNVLSKQYTLPLATHEISRQSRATMTKHFIFVLVK